MVQKCHIQHNICKYTDFSRSKLHRHQIYFTEGLRPLTNYYRMLIANFRVLQRRTIICLLSSDTTNGQDGGVLALSARVDFQNLYSLFEVVTVIEGCVAQEDAEVVDGGWGTLEELGYAGRVCDAQANQGEYA